MWGRASRPSPRMCLNFGCRSEVDAQPELDKPGSVVLRVDGAKRARPAAEVHGHVAAVEAASSRQQRMVKGVRHLHVESRADALRDSRGLRKAEVHVPAAIATDE